MKTIKLQLQKTAQYCFINGYSTTHFMRTISWDAYLYFGWDIDSPDDFYRKSTNPYMEKVINWLGYEHSPFGIVLKHKISN